jgi:RNA polymerase sigma-70 factor (ECF subfamily)
MGKAAPISASFPRHGTATSPVSDAAEAQVTHPLAGNPVIATSTDCQQPGSASDEIGSVALARNGLAGQVPVSDAVVGAAVIDDTVNSDTVNRDAVDWSVGENTELDDERRLESGPAGSLAPATLIEWVNCHHAELYRYAYRLTGNPADAEDLTQQTYLIASQRGAAVREADRVIGWLLTVLRNCHLKNRRRIVPTIGQPLEKELEAIPDAEDLPTWGREELQAALQSLPDEFRLVVMLFYFEDIPYKEIAERLQVPIGTVMSRLSRGKKLLRGQLLNTD